MLTPPPPFLLLLLCVVLVGQLVSIPVWEKQRIFRSERAALIAADIKSVITQPDTQAASKGTHGWLALTHRAAAAAVRAKLEAGQPLTLPGVITVYEMGDKMGLLDGERQGSQPGGEREGGQEAGERE